MKKILPGIKTDDETESLLEQDLSEYLNKDNFKPVTFEFNPKNKTVNLRVSEDLLEEVKTVAKKQGVSARDVRELEEVEDDVDQL